MKTETVTIKSLLDSLLSHYAFRLDGYQQIAFQMRNHLAITQTDNLNALKLIKQFDELADCPNPHHLIEIVIDNSAQNS